MASKFINRGKRKILEVDGKPFVALAGEIHNSDYTSVEYMEHIWKIADDLGMNTLLIPMSWDIVEPAEGSFDFSLAGKLIQQARQWKKRIVFLWFGSWKNAEMMYAPEWVKKDIKRFKRGQIDKGKNKAYREISPDLPYKAAYTTISYLCEEAKMADSRAFAEFMKFLKEFDEETGTVIAVQVENETGLLGAAREVSDEADAAFNAPVPADFAYYMKAHTKDMVPDVKAAVENGAQTGTWAEVFTDVAEEIFSAYYVASFVGAVAKAGKGVYNLPMTANCWLDKGEKPGSYPTGGPVSRVHEVWQYCAPSIEAYSPDIYVPAFVQVCDEFTRRDNTALFIPECATHSYCAPRMVYSVGHYHAACYAPFGFDDIGQPFSAVQGFLFGMDVNDPALNTPQNYEEYGLIGKTLGCLIPVISDKLGTDRLDATYGEKKDNDTISFGDLCVNATFKSPMQPRSDGFLMCAQLSEDEILLFGNACSINLASSSDTMPNVDIISTEEGRYDEAGKWICGRRLNGDETAFLSFDKPGVLRLRYFLYE